MREIYKRLYMSKIHWVWKILGFVFFCCLSHSYAQEPMNKKLEVATFSGGCFCCMQQDFNQIDGVESTTVGYTGGDKADPSYEEVSSGTTGHLEAVQVVYNPQKINYQELVSAYWRMIDPTRDDGQFCDTGSQYRPAIFYHNLRQKQIAEKSRQALIQSKRFPRILVQILPETTFYIAEDLHQNYSETHPIRYKFYRYRCGRDKRLKALWGT